MSYCRVLVDSNFHLTAKVRAANNNEERFFVRHTICAVMTVVREKIVVRISLNQIVPISIRPDPEIGFTDKELQMGQIELRRLIEWERFEKLRTHYGKENINFVGFGGDEDEFVIIVPYRPEKTENKYTPKSLHLLIRRFTDLRTTQVLG